MNSKIGVNLDSTRFPNNYQNNIKSTKNTSSSFRNASFPNFPNNYEENANSSTDFNSIFEAIKNSTSDIENNNSNDTRTTNDFNNTSSNSDSNNPFSNLDMGTILKIKAIMEKMNNTKNDPRSNLLLSLKPYLKPNRKEKIDQYIKIFSMTQFFQDLNNGGEK